MGHKDYGRLYQQCIDSVLFPIPISGLPTMRCFPTSGIRASAKTVAKPAILSGSIAPYVNGCPAWYGRPYRFPKSWRIMLEQLGTLFTTTMHPYMFRTILLSSDNDNRITAITLWENQAQKSDIQQSLVHHHFDNLDASAAIALIDCHMYSSYLEVPGVLHRHSRQQQRSHE